MIQIIKKKKKLLEVNYLIENVNNYSGYILAPIIQRDPTEILKINYNLLNKNNNSDNYKIEKSKYGQVINISFSSSFFLEVTENDFTNIESSFMSNEIDFSTKIDNEDKYNVFLFSKNNISIDLTIFYHYYHYVPAKNSDERSSGADTKITIYGKIENGWNILNGTIEMIAA